MRKVTFGVASSLDNFIARPDHAVDWLLWCDEAAAVMATLWKTIDAIVMGRKTYEIALKMGNGANPYPGMTTYVFSRTLKASSDPNVVIIAEDAAAYVWKMKEQPGQGICMMGGGELARSLFDKGVIDEIGLNIHPVLLGSGIPLFLPLKRSIELELVDCTSWKNGCVLVNYRVKNAAVRRP